MLLLLFYMFQTTECNYSVIPTHGLTIYNDVIYLTDTEMQLFNSLGNIDHYLSLVASALLIFFPCDTRYKNTYCL